MSKVGTALNKIALKMGSKVAPKAFPDTCKIQTHTVTKSSSGGKIKGTATNYATDVPVAYKPNKTDWRNEQGGKVRSVNEYVLTLPVLDSSGTRIDFDIEKHLIVVDARGSEPAKTFRPISVADKSGVVFEITCEKEN